MNAFDLFGAGLVIGVSEYTGARRYPDLQMFNLVGKWPKFLRWEFEPDNTTAHDVGVEMLKEHQAKGGIISIHFHPANPATGGSCNDRSGSPVAAIKPGGVKYAAWQKTLDKIADAVRQFQGPVVLRMFHEMNAWSATGGFWWSGDDRRADLMIVWRDMVRYLRDVQGCQNVLFDWCLSIQDHTEQVWSDPIKNPYDLWWPGAEYVDIVSCSLYSHRTPYAMQQATLDSWKSMKAIADRYVKPIGFSEYGIDAAQSQEGVWSIAMGMVRNLPGCRFVCLWNESVMPAIGNAASVSAQAEFCKADCGYL